METADCVLCTRSEARVKLPVVDDGEEAAQLVGVEHGEHLSEFEMGHITNIRLSNQSPSTIFQSSEQSDPLENGTASSPRRQQRYASGVATIEHFL